MERVGAVAYKLKLPSGTKMHDVFHVSLLKEHRDDGTVIPPPPPEIVVEALDFEVEQIISHDAKKKKYLVKWLGYGHENNTWEPEIPETNLANAAELINEYWQVVQMREQSTAKRGKVKAAKAKDKDRTPVASAKKTLRPRK